MKFTIHVAYPTQCAFYYLKFMYKKKQTKSYCETLLELRLFASFTVIRRARSFGCNYGHNIYRDCIVFHVTDTHTSNLMYPTKSHLTNKWVSEKRRERTKPTKKLCNSMSLNFAGMYIVHIHTHTHTNAYI